MPTKGLIRSYLEGCGRAISEPGLFFRERFASMSLSSAISFGILSVWLSSFFAFLWDSVSFIFISSLLDEWMSDIFLNDSAFQYFSAGPKQFLMGAGSLLLIPFWVFFLLLFSGMVLYFFAKLLAPQGSGVSYVAAIRVLAFALLGSWFVVVPIFGSFLSYLAILILGAVAMRESFQISMRRAAVILLMPQLMLVFLLSVVVLGLLAVAFTVPWAMLSGGL